MSLRWQQSTLSNDRLGQVILTYLQAVEAGQVPDEQAFLANYPDLREPLAAFLADQQQFRARRRERGPEAQSFEHFDVFEELGRGGMAAVLRCVDKTLDRELALKVPLARHAANADVLDQFVKEAKITARLQHPAIVPVHELGEYADRRPFFTMKLVRGQTLAKLLQQRTDPWHDQPRFIGIFEQVCQAIGYAHDLGLIHRDLKPHNVMIGERGEVQVMDWGFAIPVASPPPETAGAESSSAPTEPAFLLPETIMKGLTAYGGEAGKVVGTLAYMAPEQARCEATRFDPRADVFGLGAMLCEILTGRPPYVAEKLSDLWQQVRQPRLDEALAALDACQGPAVLVQLARDCLSAEAQARPKDGGEVAQRVIAYRAGLEEELRQEQIKTAAAQGRARAERRARRLTVGLAAAVLLFVVAGGAAGWWFQRDRAARATEQARQMAAAQQAIETDLQRVQEAQTKEDWSEAQAALERAEGRLAAGAPPHLQGQVRQARADMEFVRQIDGVYSYLLGPRDAKAKSLEKVVFSSLQAHGTDINVLTAAAVVERIKSSAIREQLLQALDLLAIARLHDDKEWKEIFAIAQEADTDAWRIQFRAAGLRNEKDRRLLVALGNDEGAAAKPSNLILAFLMLRAIGEDNATLAILRKGQQNYPNSFWVNVLLATALLELGAPDTGQSEALEYLRAGVALRPTNAAALTMLGIVLVSQGRSQEGLAACRKAVELDPELALAHLNLGALLWQTGQTKAALEPLQTAARLEPRSALAHANLAWVHLDLGDLDAAVEQAKKAKALDDQSALAYAALGTVRLLEKDPEGAIADLQRAIALNPRVIPAYASLATALMAKGRLDEAEAAGQKALKLDPHNALLHLNHGFLRIKQGRVPEAVELLRRAADLERQRTQALVPFGQRDGGMVVLTLQRALGDPALLQIYRQLATCYMCLRQYDEMIRVCQLMEEQWPDDYQAYYLRAAAHHMKGEFARGLEGNAKGAAKHAAAKKNDPSVELMKVIDRLMYEPLIETEANLDAILKGDVQPRNALERARIGAVCLVVRKEPLRAARYFEEAYAKLPREDMLPLYYRRHAIWAAALASSGQVEKGASLEPGEEVRLRRRTLEWLRAELALTKNQIGGKLSQEARRIFELQLLGIVVDPDLADFRDAKALAKLPASERKAWEEYWAEIREALKTIQGK